MKAMRWLLLTVLISVVCGLSAGAPAPAVATPGYASWTDLGIVYSAPSGDAYYPSVIYDANGFSGGSPLYKMWYSDGSGAAFVLTSSDGLSWGAPTSVTGLGGDAHHVQVVYDENCFGIVPCDTSASKYKMWYWDTDAQLYSISAMATAESVDGVTWTNDTTLTQSETSPLVTGGGTGWNRGSYGPIDVFYQAGASNTGTEPWDYSYVMYYDGTDGGREVTGLGYSSDGLDWTAYSTDPVLDGSTAAAWDCSDSAYGTVYQDSNGYQFWYSGGGGDNGAGGCEDHPVHEGIGYASSSDGKTWTKDAGNPIFHISDGVSYRNSRVYTPAVVDDGGPLRMYYSAVGDGGPKDIGLAVNAEPPTVTFVDDDWAGLPLLSEVYFPGDANPHYIGLDAFGTVQDGIDNVAGSTVNVADGTYTATSLASIVITKDGLSLIGESRDGTIIDGGAWGASGAGWPKGIHVYANDVTIQNFTVQGFTGDMESTGGYGILFRDYAHDMPDEGYIFYSGGIVENVKLQNNYSPMYALVHRNLTVRDSLIQNNFSDGMFIARESDNAVITGNTVLNSGDQGIWVGYDYNALGPSDNAIITGNTVDGAREGGISFVASDTALISGNDVSHVRGEEPEGTGGWSRGAISLKDGVSNVTVSDNVVHDNDGLGTGSGRGIGVDGTSSNITVTGNVIRNNAGGGIKVMGTTTGWTATSNSIYGNTGYGAENSTEALLGFEDNWWGSASGPTHALNTFNVSSQGDAVSDNADFVPWLDAAPPGGTSFAPVTTTDPVGSYASIQAGVDASNSGGTVNAKAGTFTEQVLVDGKANLTIQGVGPPKPKVTVGPDARAPIIHVKNSSNVAIDGFEIDGAGNGASPCPPSGGPDTDQRFYGIRYSDSSGAVSNNDVHGIDYPTICGTGVGIYAYQSSVEINGNNVYDFDKNGITANLAGTSSIHENTVTGWGPSPDIAQNGIQVGFGATGTVQSNTVSAVSYTGDYWAASGILVTSYADWGYPPSSADTTSNTVTDAQVGIYYGEGSGTIDGNVVSASAAGVGTSQFWGIIASDPADHAPSAFEPGDGTPPAGGAAPAGGPLTASPGIVTIVATGDTLTGDGSADCVGIEVDAGYGPEDIDFTASGNTISNWGTGVLVTKCTEDCSTGVFVSVDVGPDNDISGNDNGVFLDSVSGVVISGNEIHHNLNRPGYAGVGITLWGDNDDNQILGNVVHDNDRQGIFVGYCDFAGPDASCTEAGTPISTGNTVSGNTIYNNGLYTNPNGPDASAYGLQLWNADDNIITNNEIYGHDDWIPWPEYYPDYDFAQGIYLLDSNDNLLSGNILRDNNYGVGLWGPGRGNGSNLINFNTIAGNTGYGVLNLDALTVNAENNWWGACDGPSGVGPGSGDAVSTHVDYDPWLHGGCDYDGDKLADDQEPLIGTDWQNPDTDGDGCNDGLEYVAMPGFDPRAEYWYDFYDVPVPANPDMTPNGPRNRVVTMADVLAVLFYVGARDNGPANGNGVDYDAVKGSCDWNADTVPDKEGLCYDRTPSAAPDPPWEAGPPNGAVTISDVLAVLAQVGLDCSQ